MKYFKKTAQVIGPISKNDGKLWLAICKLFNQNKDVKVNYFTSFDNILHTARNDYYNELREQNDREHKKPNLESNADGDIFI